MPTPKQAHALVTYFIDEYSNKYGTKPIVNRHSARWGFDSMLMEMSTAEIKGLVSYYFTTFSANHHSLDWFLYNYEKYVVSKQKADEDEQQRKRLRAASEKRAKEWRDKIGD